MMRARRTITGIAGIAGAVATIIIALPGFLTAIDGLFIRFTDKTIDEHILAIEYANTKEALVRRGNLDAFCNKKNEKVTQVEPFNYESWKCFDGKDKWPMDMPKLCQLQTGDEGAWSYAYDKNKPNSWHCTPKKS